MAGKDGLTELDMMLKKILDDFPKARRKLVEANGDKLYKKVISKIDSQVNEDTGNLKDGVTKKVGSGGGYAAVRADYKKAPHTHLIENGHKIVRGGKVVGWVAGKHMYRNALNELADELENDAEKMMDGLVSEFNG